MIDVVRIEPWSCQVVGSSEARPWFERRGVALQITSARGAHCGVGDAAPLPGFSTESLEAATDELQNWGRRLEGEPLPTSVAAVAVWTSELQLPSSRFAADVALLGLLAGTRGQSIEGLLRPARTRPTVSLRQALVASMEDAEKAILAGFPVFKVKVGRRPLADDLALVGELARHFPAQRIRVDANGAWSLIIASKAVKAFAALKVELVEQPLAKDDLAGHRKLRGQGTAIGLDESVRTMAELKRVIAEQACDAVVLKPTLVGGVFNTLEMARYAARHGLGVILSHAFESAAGQAGLEALDNVLAGPSYLGAGIDTERCFRAEVSPANGLPNPSEVAA